MSTVYYPTAGCGADATQVPYACSQCLRKEYGRARSLLLIKEDYISTITDFTSNTQLTTALNSLNAVYLWKVNGEYDGGNTEETDGFGDTSVDNGNTTHILTINDPHVDDNWDYFDYVRRTSNWIPAFTTSSKLWIFSEPANIKVKMPVANDIKSVVTYQMVLTVTQDGLPYPVTKPSVLNSCFIIQ